MRAADELQSHRGRFSTQHPCEHAVHQLTTLVPVSIARQRCKVLGAEPLSCESAQNPLQTRRHSRCALPGDRVLIGNHLINQRSGPLTGAGLGFTTGHWLNPSFSNAAWSTDHELDR